MRERITFVHPPEADVDPKSLHVTQYEFRGPRIKAAREDRLTILLDELPTNVAELLPRFRELALRWTSPSVQDTIEPFLSRTSPGLYVSYTLVDAKDTEAGRDMCNALLPSGSIIDCASNEAFTTRGEGRSVKPPGAILHEHLEHLLPLTSRAAAVLCAEKDTVCKKRVEGLSGASCFDMTWDAEAAAVRVGALYSLGWRDIHVSTVEQRRTEVGLLSKDTPPNQEPFELAVSGLLTVLGDSKEPSGTMFSFPSRHRSTTSSFTSRFMHPTGLHPTLQLSLSSNEVPVADEHCAPYAHLTLPRTIFADRYQLADKLLLVSKNLTASRYTSLPVDLEAPAYATKPWGSSVLLELAPPPDSGDPVAWTAEVPLHLRYLEPSQTGTLDIEIPYPAVFWACDSAADADLTNNPFDRIHLGYDGLFSSSTVFWHVNPEPASGDRLMTPISVPVLKEPAASWVGLGTAAIVATGFAWILWTLVVALSRFGYGPRGGEERMESKKNK